MIRKALYKDHYPFPDNPSDLEFTMIHLGMLYCGMSKPALINEWTQTIVWTISVSLSNARPTLLRCCGTGLTRRKDPF